MAFTPHTQDQLKRLGLKEGKVYGIEYVNKDYFNGEETIEQGKATCLINDGKICFSVTDPYGMDKIVFQVRILGS